MKRAFVILILIVINSYFVVSSPIDAKAEIDTNNVLIGDQIVLKITAKANLGTTVQFPMIKDSIGKIEFLSMLKTDTLSKKEQLILSKKYILTSFDSGHFVLPALPLLTQGKKTKQIDTSFTNSVNIIFRTVNVDTSKAIKDIKPIFEEPVTFWEYVPYILLALGIVLLVLLGIWLWKRYKKPTTPELDYDPSIPPYILAIEALKQLESEKLWQKGQTKLYYSRLSDILRTYIERQYLFPAMELTTNEILSQLEKLNFSNENINDLRKVLELADLVKFAKYNPLLDENSSSMNLAVAFINTTADKKSYSMNQEEGEDNV